MDDRELLERAAKAAGLSLYFRDMNGLPDDGIAWVDGQPWNPLADDRDALRLAVKLRLTVQVSYMTAWAESATPPVEIAEGFGPRTDEGSAGIATRRAIVRAAAAIGEQR